MGNKLSIKKQQKMDDGWMVILLGF